MKPIKNELKERLARAECVGHCVCGVCRLYWVKGLGGCRRPGYRVADRNG